MDGAAHTEQAAVAAARGWDIARLVLGFVTLTVAFNGTWHLAGDRDETGPTALAVIGLIAALVALVVDLVLQRAVIGQDFDPVLRLGIRSILVATVVVYSVYDLVHGEFQDTSAGFGSFGHLMPPVGSGPVLALAGAALVLIGPWKDRCAGSADAWRHAGALTAVLAAIANTYQGVRAVAAANDTGKGVALPIASCSTWFALAVGSAVLGGALLTRRRTTWPVASLCVPCWVIVFAWQTGLNSSYDGSVLAGLDLLLKSFGTLGVGLLVLALVLAAAPANSTTAAAAPGQRWRDAARGLTLTSAGSLLVLAILAGAYLGVDDTSWGVTFSTIGTGSGSDAGDAGAGTGGFGADGPLVWILVCALALAAIALVAWSASRRLDAAPVVGVTWGVLTFLTIGITLLSSEALRYLVSSDFLVVGRSVGTLAAGTLIAPAAVACVSVLPASARHTDPAQRGGPATPANPPVDPST